jgi:hypothetical protein
MTLTARVETTITATETKTTDLSVATDVLTYNKRIELATGTGANQADLIFHDQRTLIASATEDLDLAGSLTDQFGTTLTLARIKGIVVTAAAANTNNVNVIRPASNGVPIFLAAGDGMPVKPGGKFEWWAPDATGIAVTAGTGDLLTFTNSAGTTSVTYDVIIVGASA